MRHFKRLFFELMGFLTPYNFGIGISRRGYLTLERYRTLEKALTYTQDECVDGDYIEFGVAEGRSLIFAYEICKKYGLLGKTRIIGFDSFQGFPEPKGVDRIFERFKKGELSFARKIVERNLALYGADPARVSLVEGWYEDTLTQRTKERLNIGTIRVANIDCDMFESTLLALNFISHNLVNGSVLLFDDWLCFRADPYKGEQRAVKHWLAENKKFTLIPYQSYANVGQSFIVHIQDQDA